MALGTFFSYRLLGFSALLMHKKGLSATFIRTLDSLFFIWDHGDTVLMSTHNIFLVAISSAFIIA